MPTTRYAAVAEELRRSPRSWLVTGAAGFIGSHLVETLLSLDQRVAGLDSFVTGRAANLNQVEAAVGGARWSRFTLFTGDVRDLDTCRRACRGVDVVLHQAALGSVPRSLSDPIATHESNVSGHVNMLEAVRREGVPRLVYASSSSVYGDDETLPKVEPTLGRPLSPYAATKRIGEMYSDVFSRAFSLETIGLRYFNIFGARQDPAGPYAAVIPRWVETLLRGETPVVFGDGETSRDFCYVANAVQANVLGATTGDAGAINQVYNVAAGRRTSLNELFGMVRGRLAARRPAIAAVEPRHEPFRPGDIRHTHADIDKARRRLGYAPAYTIEQGLDEALDWYVDQPDSSGPDRIRPAAI